MKKVYNHKNMRSYGKCKEKSEKEDVPVKYERVSEKEDTSVKYDEKSEKEDVSVKYDEKSGKEDVSVKYDEKSEKENTSVKYDEESEKEDVSVKYERGSEKEKLIEKYEISGNYTVEAAFIVPMILGIVFAIMYMLFLLHDKVILQENLRTAVLSIAQNENVSDGKKLVSKNLIVLKVKNADCNVGTKYVTAKANAVAKMDIPVIAYFMKKKNKIYLKTRCLKLKPESMLRRKSESMRKNEK